MSKDKKSLDLSDKVDAIIGILKHEIEERNNIRSIINNNFEILNSKIDKLESKISGLHADTNVGFDEVKLELVKIQATTQYEEFYSNLKVVNKKIK